MPRYACAYANAKGQRIVAVAVIADSEMLAVRRASRASIRLAGRKRKDVPLTVVNDPLPVHVPDDWEDRLVCPDNEARYWRLADSSFH